MNNNLENVSDNTLIEYALTQVANRAETGSGAMSFAEKMEIHERQQRMGVPSSKPEGKAISDKDRAYIARLRKIAASFRGKT